MITKRQMSAYANYYD